MESLQQNSYSMRTTVSIHFKLFFLHIFSLSMSEHRISSLTHKTKQKLLWIIKPNSQNDAFKKHLINQILRVHHLLIIVPRQRQSQRRIIVFYIRSRNYKFHGNKRISKYLKFNNVLMNNDTYIQVDKIELEKDAEHTVSLLTATYFKLSRRCFHFIAELTDQQLNCLRSI